MKIDIFDDLAGAKKPYHVIACMAVKGRRPLLEFTIKRLLNKNGCYKVICSGDDPEDKIICEASGAEWVDHSNKPLGKKWNSSFQAAKKYNPDACLFTGSSDWISDNWIYTMKPYVEKFGLVGAPGMYLADVSTKIRVCHWAGYVGRRRGESIGIGRMISSKVLDSVQWRPFHEEIDSSLDGSMINRCGKDYLVLENIKSLSLSTNIWGNKHSFSQHFNNLLPSTKVSDVDNFIKDFPELLQFYRAING